ILRDELTHLGHPVASALFATPSHNSWRSFSRATCDPRLRVALLRRMLGLSPPRIPHSQTLSMLSRADSHGSPVGPVTSLLRCVVSSVILLPDSKLELAKLFTKFVYVDFMLLLWHVFHFLKKR